MPNIIINISKRACYDEFSGSLQNDLHGSVDGRLDSRVFKTFHARKNHSHVISSKNANTTLEYIPATRFSLA